MRISPFLGALPKVNDRLLPDGHAAQATNCSLEVGSLRPARNTSVAASVASSANSIYRHPTTGVWFQFTASGVDAVRSPLNDDVWDRVYWTGQGAPRYTTYALASSGSVMPAASYTLGIPAPASAPGASDASGSPPSGGVLIDTTYVFTYVSEFGEEGPPSLPSDLVTRYDTGENVVSGLVSPPTGDYSIATKRIYRAETAGVYLLVAEIPVANTTYTDSRRTEQLGRPLPSLDWDKPDPRMVGLTNIGNGVLAGFFNSTLCFCEPYRPHAWPVGYQLGFDADIVGITATHGGLIVVTKSKPWLVSGVTPASMTQAQLDINLGGISRRSVVDMGEYAIYASDEGLVVVGGAQASLITRNILTRAQWQAYNPETIHAYRWHERYLAFYETGGTWGAFLLHPEHGMIHLDGNFATGYFDPVTGSVFLLSDNGDIHEWDTGGNRSYNWLSRIDIQPRRVSMTCARVETTGSVNITIYADGNQIVSRTVNGDMFRLPPGRYREWQIRLQGSSEVLAVQLASTPGDLI